MKDNHNGCHLTVLECRALLAELGVSEYDGPFSLKLRDKYKAKLRHAASKPLPDEMPDPKLWTGNI